MKTLPSPPRTVADLVAATGLNRNTVYAAIKFGQLPGYYVGKRVVIPADAFEAFCEGRWEPKPKQVAPIRPVDFLARKRAAS